MAEIRQKLRSFQRFIENSILPEVPKDRRDHVVGQIKLIDQLINQPIALNMFLTWVNGLKSDELRDQFNQKLGNVKLSEQVQQKLELYLEYCRSVATDLIAEQRQVPVPVEP